MNIQRSGQGCLACCLLAVANPAFTESEELACLTSALSKSKSDFVGGHLDFVATRYPLAIRRIVENPHYYRTLRAGHPHIRQERGDLTPDAIAVLPAPFVLYLDEYVLGGVLHAPHFVLVTGRGEGTYHIADPWDGREKEVARTTLEDGVRLLREHLLHSPQAIVLTSEQSTRPTAVLYPHRSSPPRGWEHTIPER